jgi:hypothetical protein
MFIKVQSKTIAVKDGFVIIPEKLIRPKTIDNWGLTSQSFVDPVILDGWKMI